MQTPIKTLELLDLKIEVCRQYAEHIDKVAKHESRFVN